MSDNVAECGRMALQEFLDGGYLAEANRQVLHPVGLALAVIGGELVVLDSRDDPDGVRFGPDSVDGMRERAATFSRTWHDRAPARRHALGYMVQPVQAENWLTPGGPLQPQP